MPNRKKKNVVVGVFETRDRADRAIAALRDAGFDADKIGMLARDASGKMIRTDGEGDETNAEEGAVAGALVGAAGGAAIGAAVLTGLIPAIGPVLAVGTLGALLANAAGGAVVGLVAGALIGWGIPEEEAEFYEGEVKAGKYLVTVEAGDRAGEARSILYRHGGFDRTGWDAVRADRTNTLAAGAFRAEDGRTIQLKEEQLKARKTSAKAGEVEVRKEVHTDRKTIQVPVEREEVVIERRPAGGRAAAGDIKAEQIRIPVKEEKVNVSKEAVVKEEVNVGKRKVRDTQTVGGDVRREELVVETQGKAKARTTDARPADKRKGR
jgi:uncharacterized protein (TIGR02271 family)